MVNKKIKKITKETKNLVQKIRDYSTLQKNLWQLVPNLALEADGRTGHSEQYSRAYSSGFWAIRASVENGRFNVFVDLATGDLVDAYSASNTFSVADFDCEKDSSLKPARKKGILELALDMEQLDAKEIINDLELEAKEPYFSGYNVEKKEAWRSEMREKYDVKEIFTR
jgi:hypothetical protein